MTRLELLKILIGQARSNGFEFRKWYVSRLGERWTDAPTAIAALAEGRRYYALLFSHDFACTFWKQGEVITFQLPSNSFQRRKADGTIGTVNRKAFTRRSSRKDVWRYHLQQLALSEEPLRYMRRYLNVEEDLEPETPSTVQPIRPMPVEFTDPEIEADLKDLLPD